MHFDSFQFGVIMNTGAKDIWRYVFCECMYTFLLGIYI